MGWNAKKKRGRAERETDTTAVIMQHAWRKGLLKKLSTYSDFAKLEKDMRRDRLHKIRVEPEFLFGAHSVKSAMDSKKRAMYSLLLDDRVERNWPLLNAHHAGALSVPLLKCTREELDHLTKPTESVEKQRHQGIVLCCSSLDDSLQDPLKMDAASGHAMTPPHSPGDVVPDGKAPFWVVLDRVQDPHNLGAILRSAEFFGVDGVVLSKKESCKLTPTVSHISAGAVEYLNLFRAGSMVQFLEECGDNGWHTVATVCRDENDSERALQHDVLSLDSMRACVPTVLVLGNEGGGVRRSVQDVCRGHVTIEDAKRGQIGRAHV